MRRFDFDEDDYYNEDTDEEMNEEIEYILPPEVQFIQMANLDLMAAQISQQLLAIVIEMLRRSWFWRWRSPQNKVKIICKTYKQLSQLIEDNQKGLQGE